MNTRITNVGSEMTNVGTAVELDVSSTAVAFSAASFPTTPTNFRYVMFQIQGQPVRITYDGTTNPTASSGQRKAAGDEAIMIRAAFLKLKFIREGSTDAKIWALPCNLT